MKAFFETIWLTISKPSSYKKLKKKTWFAGAGYLFFVLVIFSLFFSLIIAVQIFRLPTKEFLHNVKEDMNNIYPAELVLTFESGALMTNVDEPYYVELPVRWEDALMSDLPEDAQAPYLLKIDTSAHVEDYDNQEAFVLMTQEAMVYPSKSSDYIDENGEKQVNIQTSFVLYEETDFEKIDRAEFDKWMTTANPIFNWLPFIFWACMLAFICILPFFISLFWLLWLLFYLVFATLLVKLIALVMHYKATYRELYILSFYGLTLPLILELAVPKIGIHLPTFSFTVIFLVWMGFILHTIKPNRPTSASSSAK